MTCHEVTKLSREFDVACLGGGVAGEAIARPLGHDKTEVTNEQHTDA